MDGLWLYLKIHLRGSPAALCVSQDGSRAALMWRFIVNFGGYSHTSIALLRNDQSAE